MACGWRAWLGCWPLVFLGACAVAPQGALRAPPGGDVLAFDAWEHRAFPGKRPTEYVAEAVDGRLAVAARSESSMSVLRRSLNVEPAQLGRLRFSWKVPALIDGADMTQRGLSDSPVRVLLAFDGDRDKFSLQDTLLSELARALTGEHLPYATLMYVWCNACAPETVIPSTRTQRIRKIAVESGPGRLNRWLDYERDIRADFERAFGESPGALVGIGIMTDSDNTGSSARAWYGPVWVAKALAAGR